MFFEIMEANIGMCDELAKIKRQIWETTYRGIYPDEKFDKYNFNEQSEKFKNMILSPYVKLFVAKCEDKIVGYTAVGKSTRRQDEDIVEVVLLYVLKDYQGFGVGKGLFNFAKEKLYQLNQEKFFVFCNKYNVNAQNFYLKMGCRVVSIDEDNIDKSLPQIKYVFEF